MENNDVFTIHMKLLGKICQCEWVDNPFNLFQDAEHKRLGEDILHTAIQILERGDWKRERVVKGDLVESKVFGGKKLFKLTVRFSGHPRNSPNVL